MRHADEKETFNLTPGEMAEEQFKLALKLLNRLVGRCGPDHSHRSTRQNPRLNNRKRPELMKCARDTYIDVSVAPVLSSPS